MPGTNTFRFIREWLGRLVRRPADLFDIASGTATAYFISLIAWNMTMGAEDPELAPSLSFLTDVAPLWVWLSIVGVVAIGQPIALHFDDANDPRHPLLQPWKLARNLLATLIGVWFSILYWSLFARVGPHHIHALYALVIGMNGYIVAHVLFRARR